MSETPPLESWERGHYSPGGGDAFLFYVVFGKFPQPLELSTIKYRSNGVPPGINLGFHRNWMDEPTLNTSIQGYLGQILRETPGLYEDISSSPECITIMGTVADPENLNYLRDTIGLIMALLDKGGVGVYDPQRFAWWSRASWSEEIFEVDDSFLAHCIILLSEEENSSNTKWVHTRGLRKFGRPDVSFRGVPEEKLDAAVRLCERFIQHQALGLLVPEGQQIKMADLPDGMVCKHGGDLGDPDFNNVHFEIVFPAS